MNNIDEAMREVADWLAEHACIEVPGMAEQADKLRLLADQFEEESRLIRQQAMRWRRVEKNPWSAMDILNAKCTTRSAFWKQEAREAIDAAMAEESKP